MCEKICVWSGPPNCWPRRRVGLFPIPNFKLHLALGTELLDTHFRKMPRYFFHVHDVAPSTDEHGEELPDDEAAWLEASRYTAEVFKDLNGKFRPGQDWLVEVTDEAQEPIYFIGITSRTLK